MFTTVVLGLITPIILYSLSSLWCLLHNYLIAKNIGLHIILIPVRPDNPLWILLSPYIIPLFRKIPFGNGTFTRFCRTDWYFSEGYEAHRQFGDAIILCSPGANWLYLCDPKTARDILRRERAGEFGRDYSSVAMLDVFGPNISTAEGQDWQRQRKCTAVSFNEHSNALVFQQALRQGKQAVEYWASFGDQGMRSTAQDVKTVALNVLSYAGFGKEGDFKKSTDAMHSEGPLSFQEALSAILGNAILVFALGPSGLKSLSFIHRCKRLGEAISSLQKYMTDMIEQTARTDRKRGLHRNLLQNLAEASADGLLSKEEVIGNMFVYNFAGHDTTSHALATTLHLLAAYPEVQEWMAEEIDHVVTKYPNGELPYEALQLFPRTLSVLYETLRLYDPVPGVVKRINNTNASQLTISDKTYLIPKGTMLDFNYTALHMHPNYWGDDAAEWKPSRWIRTEPGRAPVHEREAMRIPDDGSFLAWSDELRGCPGKKFAQVEHVGVMVSMFRQHRVEPVREEGENQEDARRRVKEAVADTGMRLLLQMLHPEKVALRWKQI
ncbi:cytochrome P450 monooxygenase-like protein [Sporormia fimetaria CBS 119925]|uniref:Cytochrome P450 monooxygenase-like protein n=1 Tax=Sporormia fimetaria CBS 119925 TaxID=1340428 RepID=A0A6A6VNZ4_9PLEO|nr:cytochrome P450 monooxygenase-like protein [Sporormia fimetaria CBS 119925]